jgi:plasmid stabilization system protein ParE
MTYSINISDQAKKDLMGIFGYIFCCLKSPINAQE